MTPQKFGVRGIPTIMLFNDGKLIDTKVGSLPKSLLKVGLNLIYKNIFFLIFPTKYNEPVIKKIF